LKSKITALIGTSGERLRSATMPLSALLLALAAAVVLKDNVTPVRLAGAILVAGGVAVLEAGG
jgi:drug/metabolite transporter (DMT)-like permease